MKYKNLIIVFITISLIIAGSLALLKDKTILGAQYKRCAQLILQGDQLFLNKNYEEASQKYRGALTIDPKNSRLWSKFLESEKQSVIITFEQKHAKASSQTGINSQEPSSSTKIVPPASESQPQGATIVEDEGC